MSIDELQSEVTRLTSALAEANKQLEKARSHNLVMIRWKNSGMKEPFPNAETESGIVILDELMHLRERCITAESALATVKQENAALLKQWNDLDVRNEKRHREWSEQLATVEREREEIRASFKNFHRSLCERFGVEHDEQDWRRDLCSLEEWIAKRLNAIAQERDELRGALANVGECAEVLKSVLDTEPLSESVRGAIQGCVNALEANSTQGAK